MGRQGQTCSHKTKKDNIRADKSRHASLEGDRETSLLEARGDECLHELRLCLLETSGDECLHWLRLLKARAEQSRVQNHKTGLNGEHERSSKKGGHKKSKQYNSAD